MGLHVATHSGPFHADDVLAWALVQCFVDDDATVVRTRDPDALDAADLVFDVGGSYDASKLRFDHHQASYQGPLSSAGMVLEWLLQSERIERALFEELRLQIVHYVDEVDNGRVAPIEGVPCFPSIVGSFNLGCETLDDFDQAFRRAAEAAMGVVRGIAAGVAQSDRNAELVQIAMSEAAEQERNYMVLNRYVKWKKAYFEQGGRDHCTEFLLHPGIDDRWRVIAIPPEPGSFDKKLPLPKEWAGLRDEELAQISGVKGAVFCHKNCFIAVWETREQLEAALRGANLLR
jgi:uncharacterized UPF0160 family protein